MVSHYPPGTLKWNKIEHQLFCPITHNWRGKPLISRMTVVELIAANTTKTSLTVRCKLDTRTYENGIKVGDGEMATLNIEANTFPNGTTQSPHVGQRYQFEAVVSRRILSVHPTRNPGKLGRSWKQSQLCAAERRSCGRLNQEPPRTTRYAQSPDRRVDAQASPVPNQPRWSTADERDEPPKHQLGGEARRKAYRSVSTAMREARARSIASGPRLIATTVTGSKAGAAAT